MLLRFPDLTAASRAAADMIRERASRAVEDRGWFSLALSGGETPRELFRLLADDAELPWLRTHVFWADERHVPPESPHSNVHLARQLLLSRVPIPEANVHAPDTSLSPLAAAREYDQRIRGVFSSLQHGNGSMPSLDVILLGLGRDGHTASLFPGSPLLAEQSSLVAASPAAGSPAVARLTMTLPLINAARTVIFLLAGEEKLGLLEQILGGRRPDAPAAMIKPNRELYWLVADR
ncbi:6-phosphogluconolactonase [Desulfocurvibacter africanus]|uniref:6-phosphogluconolactonase n=1 Tax=Desulfocurvibacter africanus subsp. africanus str. Walvis Bay TaxID=690850 RepID=F3YTS2_DESAF|nr:6-phosphogluconolactonase [Desulfocurvibacter africanus]EGJ48453.1 6-phosphogluconolactonase [Desulfocurvibacter africanus subsp. africanus str. Walvis Bay]